MSDFDDMEMTRAEMIKQREEQIVESYRQDEDMMILVFTQWCVNRGFDARELYYSAYPDQLDNPRLEQGIRLTVPKEEAGDIPNDTLFGVLSMYGNDDLAFVVSEALDARQKLQQRQQQEDE
ncbi:hypothetical protein [Paenibacillus campi]|uniref:hypothetical protein n=1 Tax=Paenibacillus campi TaxID=3106031 RepID=UPI002AFFC405|nr:hypothetical protein [Paenibacillus sp. SGZ-1009]